ncbi:pilus assembly FimT family protein [Marinospirillum alkaliphilum]|uniref:Type IV fimbrial biogenesis protein FimT n=1 Tax=Marinospirillum alkaliphilum DSM 21637 TaxID=1122209 RepID=A0A1K1W579_9GAMM|nr:prepilin-type N-terminal cleavage/methylation domain-containing protein [Marinospirillum alkaliphilum]SFX32585.1 type IV fimbrial biogenesis protein FimT [Marinospirillum alkaliphilum DSM 21637]
MLPASSLTLRHRQKGFNLLELLVVLALVGIIFGIAMPAGQGMLDRSRLTAATNEAYSALLYTRNEASRLRQEHRLCFIASATATSCGTTPASFMGVFSVPTTGTPLRVKVFELTPQATFSFSGVSNHQLSFQALGNRQPAATAGTPVFIEVQVGAANTRQVEVCFNGRVVIRQANGTSECQ